MSEIQIIKSNGEREYFDREKLKDSLLRSSASLITTNEIITNIEKRLKSGMTTSQIYNMAFAILNKKEHKTALKYSIRRSLLALGPTGFPFEKFISEILNKKGYKTMTGQILQGKCVDHEVDIIAFDENELILFEVKFHNELSVKTDLKVALYVKARWDDLRDSEINLGNGVKRKPTKLILITNTKFTETAEKYAMCSGLELMSWDFPKTGSLYDLIEETKLHPITVVSSLSKGQKEHLISEGCLTANQMIANPNYLKKIGFGTLKIEKVVREAKEICGIQ